MPAHRRRRTNVSQFGVGYLGPEKIGTIPPKLVPRHEFCFYLHDMMAHLVVEVEALKVRTGSFELSEAGQKAAERGSEDLIDHLLQSEHRPKATRLFLNHVLAALISDYLHFVYEGLIALAKRKFAVGFSLLRKPFKEDLLHLAWIVADAQEYFDKFEADPAMFMESRKTDSALRADIMNRALGNCILSGSFDSALIERLIYNKDDQAGLAILFDKATHLVTGARALRTEPMNLNFIFKDPRDNDLYESTYGAIALVLMYSAALLFTEVERVAPLDTPYVRRRLLIAFMVYEALFESGPPKLYRILQGGLGDLLKCPVCKSKVRARKAEIPRLLISERIGCRSCGSDVAVPILWLMALGEIDIAPKELDRGHHG